MQEMLSTQVSSSRCQRICYHKYVKVQIFLQNIQPAMGDLSVSTRYIQMNTLQYKPMNVSNNVNNEDHRIILQVTGLKYQCM